MVAHSRSSRARRTGETPVRAAIYTRISLDRSGEGHGVQRQLDACNALADRFDWPVVEHFSDNDISAMTGAVREGFEALLDAIKRGDVNAVICWQPDRLYRRISDLSRLLELPGVQIRTVNGGDLDLSNSTGRMIASILGSVATQESELKVERQLAAARQLAERGRPKWRNAFGYLPYTGAKADDTGEREPDPATAPLIARAYERVIDRDREGITGIAVQWNAAGALPESGTPWTTSTVSQFLRKPRNCALREHNGEIVCDAQGEPVRGTWTPLVDEMTWRRAQAVLTEPGRGGGRKSVRRHLLTGLLLCGRPDCGHHLSGQQTNDRRIAYACKRCRGVSVRAEHVEPLILGLVSGRLAMPDAVDLLRDDGDDEGEAETLRTEKLVLLRRLDEVADERADGMYDGREYRKVVDRIKAKLTEIEQRERERERPTVFGDLPLGRPEVAGAVAKLATEYPDRLRGVIDALMTPTVSPVGKGGRVFDPNRVDPRWRQ